MHHCPRDSANHINHKQYPNTLKGRNINHITRHIMAMIPSYQSTNESANSLATTFSSFYPPLSIPIISSLSILGLSGNILVCFTIWKATFLHTITNYLIVNLAISDSLVCIFSALQILWNNLVFPRSEIAKHIFCHLFASEILLWLSTTGSAIALILVSLERFIGVVYPLHYQLFITGKRVQIAIFFQWIVALIAQAHHVAFFWYDETENSCVFKVSREFYALQNIVSYVFPVVMLTFFYYRMFSSLKTTQRLKGISNTFNARMEQNRIARRNILINLFMITILYVAFWTPCQVMFLLKYFLDVKISDATHATTVYQGG